MNYSYPELGYVLTLTGIQLVGPALSKNSQICFVLLSTCIIFACRKAMPMLNVACCCMVFRLVFVFYSYYFQMIWIGYTA